MATPSRQPSEPAAILASVEPSDLKEDELLEFGIWNLDLEGGKVDSSRSLLPTLEEMVNSHKTNESAGSLKETLPIDILSYDFGHWTLDIGLITTRHSSPDPHKYRDGGSVQR